MNLDRARRTGAAALLAFLLSAGPSLADVKLRIYLQDGALQAGTLVTETAKSFVVLTSEGRVEVPKGSIMFINGKTLKQWQDRPDKLFQTEIMPSDVPDPSYVNDKSLPPPPPVPAMPVTAKAAPAPKAPPAVAVSHAAPPVKAVVKEKPAVAAKKEEAPAKKEVAESPAAPVHTEKTVARVAVVKKAPVHSAKQRAAAPISESDDLAHVADIPAGVGRFDRTAAGAIHRARGREFSREGEKGRAIQEFRIALLLEPGNPENPLELGRLFHDQGVSGEARRFFANPLLRKNSEAKEQIEKIEKSAGAAEESLWKLRAMTVAASFGWLPLVVGMRLVGRRRKARKAKTISADDLVVESVVPSPVPAFVANVEAPAFEDTVRIEEFMKPLPPLALVEEPAPVFEPPVEEYVEEPAPYVEEVIEETPLPVEEPVFERPEPVAPQPEPLYASARNIPPPDPEEILSVARTMEASLIRANQFAVEGNLEMSRRSYRTALALNPSCASAHLGLGYVSFVEEKWEIALLHYRKALDIDGSSADAHYGIARVLLEINRVEDALPELRATLQLDPTYDDARDTLTALSKPA